MKSIAIFNNKGGVGKTTLLCNIASYLSVYENRSVLVVDADPQCNATQYMFSYEFIEDIYRNKSSFTIDSIVKPLSAGRGFAETVSFYNSNNFRVDVMVGDPKLALREDLLARDWGGAISGDERGLRTSFLFRNLLTYCENYDYVVFDMGPSLGSINRAVLLACDFFLVPMSIDLFSIRATENISTWMKSWRKSLERGLELLEEDENLGVDVRKPSLTFAGYVQQQYTAKTSSTGQRVAVKAYERIMKQIPKVVDDNFVTQFGGIERDNTYNLGEIPNLHSLVPLAQTSRKPIFNLKASDGVVGAHFTKVKEAKTIYENIVKRLLTNVEASND